MVGTGWVSTSSQDGRPSNETYEADAVIDGSRTTRSRPGSDGGPPFREYQAARGGTPRRGLALYDPEFGYTSPPLPQWLQIHTPTHEGPPSPELILLSAPNCLASQQFRALRYRVEQEPDAQIIAVISPRRNEGKSVTAANLALALSEGGRVKVLLIDSALRHPAQSRLFGLRSDFGLTTAIAARRQDPRASVDVIGISQSLYLLPAGPRVGSAHAALASEPAAHLLGSLRRLFRYILIDSSAVFGAAETLSWHGMIDRYVLVARRGLTDSDDLSRAANRLNRDKILGVTFVGASARTVGA
jgi:Mrp family chromosome partitioning ATPase